MRKNKQFSIRISSQDLETIRQKAAQAHMSQSDYVTACCLGKRIMILNGLTEVLRQQKAIGNNLNQISLKINAGAFTSYNFREVIEMQKAIYEELYRISRGGAAPWQP